MTHWGLQPTPLTVNLVRRMAASLREGGYRAVDQYFSRARQEHLRAIGEAPSDVVEDAIKMYTRACQRGIGPHEFKDCFRFERLVGLRALRVPPSREDITNLHDDQCLWPAGHGRHGHVVDGARHRALVRTRVPRLAGLPKA